MGEAGMVMRIVTKFTSVEEFVQLYSRFCAHGTCFIPGAHAARADVETAFSLQLADGTPVLRGMCIVVDSWTSNTGPYGRPGVQLGVHSLTPESKLLFQELLAKPTVLMEPLDSEGIPEPIDAVDSMPAHGDATVPMARPPIMTLLGVAPLASGTPRAAIARVAMPALSNEIRLSRAPRRGMWARLIGRVRALFRTVRWAYRRRRGVRASMRRLPTRM